MSIQLTTNQKIAIVLGIITCGVIGAVIYFYMTIWQGALKVQEKKQALASEQESIKFLSEIRDQVVEVQAVADAFDTRFIDAETPVNFIELIEKSARVLGVQVTIETVATESGGIDEAANVTYNHIVMSIRIVGDWNGVQAFLKHFQNMPHHIDIEFMRLSRQLVAPDKDSEPIERWTAELSFKGITQ
jgi:Tfp pilus assembly protein PilO